MDLFFQTKTESSLINKGGVMQKHIAIFFIWVYTCSLAAQLDKKLTTFSTNLKNLKTIISSKSTHIPQPPPGGGGNIPKPPPGGGPKPPPSGGPMPPPLPGAGKEITVDKGAEIIKKAYDDRKISDTDAATILEYLKKEKYSLNYGEARKIAEKVATTGSKSGGGKPGGTPGTGSTGGKPAGGREQKGPIMPQISAAEAIIFLEEAKKKGEIFKTDKDVYSYLNRNKKGPSDVAQIFLLRGWLESKDGKKIITH